MVKAAMDSAINWFRLAWPVLTFTIVLALSGMKAYSDLSKSVTVHIASSNQQHLNVVKEMSRIDATGTQGLQSIKDRITVVETKGDQYQLDISEIKGNLSSMRRDLSEVMSDTKIMKDYVLRSNTQ